MTARLQSRTTLAGKGALVAVAETQLPGGRVISKRVTEKASTPRAAAAAWLFALVLFAGIVALMLHYSELEELKRLLAALDPRWLLAAAALQTATYFCAARIWQVALRRERQHVGLLRLVRLSLVMLFTNQAFPSAGLSGGSVVVHALRQGRGRVPAKVAMGALLVGLITTYLAYLVAIPISLLLLRLYHALSVRQAVAVSAGFAVITFGVVMAVAWYRRSLAPRMGPRIKDIPVIGALLVAIGRAPARLLRDRAVLTHAAVLQFVEFMLDAATLHVIVAAFGARTSPAAMFGSFVIASAVARMVPVPMGLGSSEASLVLMLRAVGLSLEAAMASTLVFRGFTFWFPMLPGLVFARHELWRRTPRARRQLAARPGQRRASTT